MIETHLESLASSLKSIAESLQFLEKHGGASAPKPSESCFPVRRDVQERVLERDELKNELTDKGIPFTSKTSTEKLRELLSTFLKTPLPKEVDTKAPAKKVRLPAVENSVGIDIVRDKLQAFATVSPANKNKAIAFLKNLKVKRVSELDKEGLAKLDAYLDKHPVEDEMLK